MEFIEVPSDKYEEYRHLFNQEHCPQSFVDSVFTFKSVPLKVDNEENPNIAFLDFTLGVIVVGDPDTIEEEDIAKIAPEKVVIVADVEKWRPKLLEYFRGRLFKIERIKLSHKSLNLEKLEKLKKPLPDGYSLERVDRKTAEMLPKILQVHIPVFYGSVDNFIEKSIGFCVKHGDKPISMASGALPHNKHLEMQVSTVDSQEYRRKGFGTTVCIALIEHCLKNNIEPHWEAVNEISAKMALKLGYSDPKEVYHYFWKKKSIHYYWYHLKRKFSKK